MATFKRFDEIIAWQLADLLCSEIHRIVRETNLGRDFKLRDQILDSSDSIKNNIAEGFGRSGNKEFIQFLHIAHGSCSETQSQLTTVFSRGYIVEEDFRTVRFLCYRVNQAIFKLIKYLEESPFRGPKYRHREP